MNTNFALQDADTVAVMLKEHGRYLPKPNLDIAKDVRWNRQLLSSALTKGILLGESIPKISKRVSKVIGGSIHGQVMRVARTCVTAAENAGRIASYDRAESIGIELKKEWLATLDMRTRSSHRLLDGEQVANDETFSNGCEYPGDPNCDDYGEIANCRCTMVAAVEGVDQSNAARWSRLPDGMTYGEWKSSASSGAVSGALNDLNDPEGVARYQHAKRYYKEVTRRNRVAEIEAVSKGSGFSARDISRVYDHVFVEEHDLWDGKHRFTPDYDMAQSWQRLRLGKNVQKHDITLIKHELRERELMESGLPYEEAHAIACKEGYNYQVECERWKRSRRGGA